MYVDYKYLFPFRNQLLYAQCYVKPNGRFFSYNQTKNSDYAASYPEEFLEYGRGKFTEYGFGIGYMHYFNKTDGKFGLDLNINLAFRNGSKLTSHYTVDKGWLYASDSYDLVFPYFRFTFFYHFFRYQQ